MRIVHLNSEKGWRGGEAQLVLLAKGLKKKGHEQWIGGHLKGRLIEEAKKEGFQTYGLNLSFEFDLVAIWNLVRILKTCQVDVLHMHTPRAITIGGIASKIANVKVNIISRRVDFSLRNNLLRKIKYQWGIDRIIAISHAIKRTLVCDGIRPQIVDVIQDGIDLDRFDSRSSGVAFRTEIGVSEKAPLMGMIAHFADHKGHRYLIEAAEILVRKIPDAHFVLVGEGELKDAIQVQTQKLGLEKTITFTGFRNDIPNILASLDLFVLSSHLEGLCTSLMDAMVMSLPIVATRAGGIPEVVEDGVTGLLVPAKNPEKLAAAMTRLIEDESLRVQYGRAGRRRVESLFGAEAMVSMTEALYQKILRAKTNH